MGELTRNHIKQTYHHQKAVPRLPLVAFHAMEKLEGALRMLKEHPGAVKSHDTFWRQLINSLCSLHGATAEKVAAVASWRADGLLQHATTAFEQGVNDLVLGKSHSEASCPTREL
jgi:uridine phosphorylase